MARQKKTPAQIAEDHLLVVGMEAELVGDEAEAGVKVATLEIAYGEGEPFRVGRKSYDLAPFATKNLKRAYALLNRVPAILTAQALAAKDGERADLERLTETYNALLGRSPDDPEKPELGQEYVANLLANYPQLLGENPDACAPVLELAVLALSRRHPEVTAEEIEDEFDLAFIVRFVRALSRVNTGLADSFLTAPGQSPQTRRGDWGDLMAYLAHFYPGLDPRELDLDQIDMYCSRIGKLLKLTVPAL